MSCKDQGRSEMRGDRGEFAFRVMTVPKGIREVYGGLNTSPTYCSLCDQRIHRALIITKGERPTWWGICLWCVQQMIDAVEDAE